jgi:H+/Cl- antiporter ClcA
VEAGGHGITPGGYLRLIGLGAVIGVPAALLAAVFLQLVHWLEEWLWHDLPDALGYSAPPWFLVVGLPVCGAAVVIVARLLLPGDGGHSPLEGIKVTPTPLRYGPGVALAALGTLAFGAVLGPEAPLIALGSVTGLLLTPFLRLGKEEENLLATAGSFSAVSALFGGPLVAGMLLVEAGVGLGARLIPVLLPGLVAAATGYVLFIGLGDWGGIEANALTVPGLPLYDGTHIRDLILAPCVGIVVALILEGVKIAGRRIAGPGLKRLGMATLLLLGGLATGLLAQTADWLGASSQDVLFSGQNSIPALVAEDSTKIVLILVVAKTLAYAVCLSCGFRGGPVFPAIFTGIGIAMVPVILWDVSPTWAVAVGVAAGMAGMTRLVFASLLFGAILVGTQGLDTIPAAVLAAAAAWLVATAIERRKGEPAA